MIRLTPWREMEDWQVGVVVGAAVGFEGWSSLVRLDRWMRNKFLRIFSFCSGKVFPQAPKAPKAPLLIKWPPVIGSRAR